MSEEQPSSPRQFVVGCEAEGLRWFVSSEVEGEMTDDLDLARRFSPLSTAVEAAEENQCNVFEISGDGTLRELLVDLRKIEQAPFERCYRVNDHLIAGPCYISETSAETVRRIRALVDANVRAVVSLVDRSELFWMRHKLGGHYLDEVFQQYFFPIRDGAAPSRDAMRITLDAIDATIDLSRVVFAHCIGGRGRTGTVVGCWLARHGVATGVGALDALTELRFEHGLFRPSPETDAQRQLVTGWGKGE